MAIENFTVFLEIFKIFKNEVRMNLINEPVPADRTKVSKEIIERNSSNTPVLNYVLLLQNIQDKNEAKK